VGRGDSQERVYPAGIAQLPHGIARIRPVELVNVVFGDAQQRGDVNVFADSRPGRAERKIMISLLN
jgi:hypothetical protein